MSATGSGKTITAAASALESFAGGPVLATVPTLDLLAQTAQAWRLGGHRAPVIADCSLEDDPVLGELGVRTTKNPIQLALWAASGRVVVFAPYASPVDPEDIDAPRASGRSAGPWRPLYRQRTAVRAADGGFDLAIVDEAHETAGDLGRPWAAIASMTGDPDGTYGARLAEPGLSEAIERGILAGFEINVLEIRGPSPVLGESEEAQRGRRRALLQAALLERAAAYNLRTVMTFHQKVEAAAFADKLPVTAAEPGDVPCRRPGGGSRRL